MKNEGTLPINTRAQAQDRGLGQFSESAFGAFGTVTKQDVTGEGTAKCAFGVPSESADVPSESATLAPFGDLRGLAERLRRAVEHADLAAVAALADSLALAALRAEASPMTVAERDRAIRRLRAALAPRLSSSTAAELIAARARRFESGRFRFAPGETCADAISEEIRRILISCGSFPSARTLRRILAKSS